MNVAQLIGQLYDPDCDMKLFFDGYASKIPKLDFTLCVDRPSSSRASSLSYVGCTISGNAARWFCTHVTHGDIVALDGFIDSRIIRFATKKDKHEIRVVVTHLNWVGSKRKKKLVAGTEPIDLGGADLKKAKDTPLEEGITVVEVPEEDDNGQYDNLPDWGGGFGK